MQNTLMNELIGRGFINQCSNMDVVADLLDNGKISVYLGSDPTADSLHVGHLVPIMMMRWLQKYGHKPLMLVGKTVQLNGYRILIETGQTKR